MNRATTVAKLRNLLENYNPSAPVYISRYGVITPLDPIKILHDLKKGEVTITIAQEEEETKDARRS